MGHAISKARRRVFVLLAVLLGTAAALVLVEIVARIEGSYDRFRLAGVRRSEIRAARDDSAMREVRVEESRMELIAGERLPQTPSEGPVSKLERLGPTDLPAIAARLRSAHRAALPPVAQAAEAREVLVLGDSFSYGALLHEEEAWPSVFQRAVTTGACRPREVIVHNLAWGGDYLSRHSRRLRYRLEAMREVGRSPALILHQLFVNDFTNDHYARVDGISLRTVLARKAQGRMPSDRRPISHTLFFLRRLQSRSPLVSESYLEWMQRFGDPRQPHWQLARASYREIVELAEESEAPLVTFLVPAQIWKGESYALEALHVAARNSLAPLAPHYLDFLPLLQARIDNGYDHWVNAALQDAHPDAFTQLVYADLLIEYLRSSRLLGDLCGAA